MPTYSLALTGVPAAQTLGVESLVLPDDVVPLGTTSTITVATLGGMANAMRNNTPFLARLPDGSQAWHTLDAERSTADIPVLKRV